MTPALWIYLHTRGRRSAALAVPSGHASADGPVVWFHATTETQADALTEITERLRDDHEDLFLLVTTADEAVARHAVARLPLRAAHVALPADTPDIAAALISAWSPEMVIWTSQVSHPAILHAVDAAHIPMILVDAEIPGTRPRSFIHSLPGLTAPASNAFRAILTRNEQVKSWFEKHRVHPDRVELAGDIQEGAVAPSCDYARRSALSDMLRARPVWHAAHVTQAEEEAVLTAHQNALRITHKLLLILCPDDPARAEVISAECDRRGLRYAIRSEGRDPGEDCQVWIADVQGEAGLLLRLAPLSYLGRSLVDGRAPGVSPFDAAALGSAILHGPFTGDFHEIYERLGQAGAAQEVRDVRTLTDAIETLLAPDMAASMAHNAWLACSSSSHVTDRVTTLVTEALDQRGVA